MPIFGLLGLLFVAAKLFGYITWSWWLVLLPIYGPIMLSLLILAVGAILTFVGLKRL